MDKFLIYNEFMNIGVNITKFSDNTPIPCAIIDFEPKPFGKMEQWLVLKNLDKERFNNTNDMSLLIPIPNSDIKFIDYQIK